MTYSKIEKAAKWIQEIKSIDAEIIRIDKIAMQFADNENEIRLQLSQELMNQPEPEVKESEYPMIDWSNMLFGTGLRSFRNSGCTPVKEELKLNVSNSTALQILGLIIYDKKMKREALIKKCEAVMKPIN